MSEQLQIGRERVRQIENEALQKLRRLDGERVFAYHQELERLGIRNENEGAAKRPPPRCVPRASLR